MSGRQLLAEALRDGLTGWQIVADPREIDVVIKPGAVVLWTNKISRPPKFGLDMLSAELTLWILTAATKPADIADDLDAKFEEVAGVLEPLQAFVWTEAEWGVLNDKFDGVRLTVTCNYLLEPEPEPEPEIPEGD